MTDKAPLPNIVFIMADDMGYGDAGCYGATRIPTPNIDRLASEGMRFTDAHSASAVCTPSRYGVMTGRYCWRSRMTRGVLGGFGAPVIEPDRTTVASMLKARGYATAAVGKWHLGLGWATKDQGPLDEGRFGWDLDGFDVDYSKPITGGPTTLGFDYFFGISGSLDMPPYCFIENDHTVGIPDLEKEPYNTQQSKGLMTPGWRDDQVDVTFATKAVQFVENHTAESPAQPFWLYLTPSAPHRPCMAPDFMEGRSRAGNRGDMVALYDWVVGELLATLQRLNIADNTLVIVTSDNGARLTCADGNDYGHKSCGDLRGQKADIWDGGHREPLIVRWPGRVKPGTTCDQTVCLLDFMATFAAIAGAQLDDDDAPDSYNILPAMLGQAPKPIREAIVHHSVSGMFSIRQGPWKLIFGLGSGGFSKPRDVKPAPGRPGGQLYNMADDPGEMQNLWRTRPDIVERLTAMLENYRTEGRSRPQKP